MVLIRFLWISLKTFCCCSKFSIFFKHRRKFCNVYIALVILIAIVQLYRKEICDGHIILVWKFSSKISKYSLMLRKLSYFQLFYFAGLFEKHKILKLKSKSLTLISDLKLMADDILLNFPEYVHGTTIYKSWKHMNL